MEGGEAPCGRVGGLRMSPAWQGLAFTNRRSGIWTLWGNRVVQVVWTLWGTPLGISTENLGLFGDRCWTLSVTPQMVCSSVTNRLS
jgi:hypothetical protein